MELHTSLRWRWHSARDERAPISRVGTMPTLHGTDHAAQPRQTGSRRKQNRPAAAGRTDAGVPTHRLGPDHRARSEQPVGPFQPLLDWFAALGRRAALAVVFQAAVVATVIIAVVVGQFWQAAPGTAVVPCGQIVGMKNALWSSAGPAPRVGDTVTAGTRFDLGLGLVEIASESAATVVLEGPASFAFVSPRSVSLLRGRLTATVSKTDGAPPIASATGPLFTVQTATAVVRDLGTQFGVEVDPTGSTSVHVFDGLVECGGKGFAAAAPMRLAGGQAADVNRAGHVDRKVRDADLQRFALALAPVTEVSWNEARATSICRDTFMGVGPLAGTAPAPRGGIGEARWVAPDGDAWRLSPAGLEMASPGSASLPFRPQAGRVYRLAVDMTVTAGGTDWAAAGFSGPTALTSAVLTCAWMFQRHMASGIDRNGFFVGADAASLQFSSGDQKTGRRTFVILLDATRPRWTVTFVADGQRLRSVVVPVPARIESVGISCHGSCRAVIHSFSLSSMEPANGS